MTDFVPPTPIPQADASSSAQQVVREVAVGRADIVSLPPDLKALPPGTRIEGEVVAQNKDGTVRIQTQQGEVVIKPRVALSEGQKIALQVPASSNSSASAPNAPPQVQVILIPRTSLPPVPSQSAQMPVDVVTQSAQPNAPLPPVSSTPDVELSPSMQKFVKLPVTQGHPQLARFYFQPAVYHTDANGTMQLVAPQNTAAHALTQALSTPNNAAPLPSSMVTHPELLNVKAFQAMDSLIKMVMNLPSSQNFQNKPLNLYQPIRVSLPLTQLTVQQPLLQTSPLALQRPAVLPTTSIAIQTPSANVQQPLIESLLQTGGQSQARQNQAPLSPGVSSSLPAPQNVKINILQAVFPGQENLIVKAPLRLFSPSQLAEWVAQQTSPKGQAAQLMQALSASKTPMSQPVFAQNTQGQPLMGQMIAVASNSTTMSVPMLQQASVAPQSITNNMMPALVVGTTADQQFSVLLTSSGIIAMPVGEAGPMATGTAVLIQMQQSIPPNMAVPNVPASNINGITNPTVMNTPGLPPLDVMMGQDWPALEQAIQALLEANPAIAQSVQANVPMPTVPPQFTPAVLFFLAALRMGDVRSWMGNKALEALKRAGKEDIVSRLTHDFSSASARSKQPVADNWRPFALPILYDEQLQRLQMFVRDHDSPESEEDGGSDKKQTRFLIDLVLSRLGEIQMDGLVREKRLDMAIRTRQPLASDMQQEIRNRFTHAMELTGMDGSIMMYGRSEGWVKVDRPKGASGVQV